MFSDANLALVYHVYVKKFYKAIKLRTLMLMKKLGRGNCCDSTKNIEVLRALDITRQRLQFKGENMDTFFRLERKMQGSMQNKIKQTTIAQYFA